MQDLEKLAGLWDPEDNSRFCDFLSVMEKVGSNRSSNNSRNLLGERAQNGNLTPQQTEIQMNFGKKYHVLGDKAGKLCCIFLL